MQASFILGFIFLIFLQACQLVRAVSTLLKLNTEEEQYVKDYLQYKVCVHGLV